MESVFSDAFVGTKMCAVVWPHGFTRPELPKGYLKQGSAVPIAERYISGGRHSSDRDCFHASFLARPSSTWSVPTGYRAGWKVVESGTYQYSETSTELRQVDCNEHGTMITNGLQVYEYDTGYYACVTGGKVYHSGPVIPGRDDVRALTITLGVSRTKNHTILVNAYTFVGNQSYDFSVKPGDYIGPMVILPTGCKSISDLIKNGAYQAIYGQCASIMESTLSRFREELYYQYNGSNYSTPLVHAIGSEGPMPMLDDTFAFWEGGHLPGYPICNLVQSQYYLQWLQQHALKDAYDQIEGTWDNGITNVVEIAEMLRDLKHGKISIPRSWQDAWLKYRYVISTGVLDAQEAAKGLAKSKIKEALAAYLPVAYYGTSTMTVDGVNIVCRVRIIVRSTVRDALSKAYDQLLNWGLIPDLYLLWDLVPYSFVVDWFLPISDVLDIEDMKNQMAGRFEISNYCVSLKYQRKIDGYTVKNYSRWASSAPPSLAGCYWFKQAGSSNKTLVKRVIDSAALLFRR
ncbi:TPA_asm: maturation protein [ssRNA phage SRR7976300_2]|uniref:Maturation protein n=1 Tax=ssRNA phage SRR7976300_2 TaxID=2786651 RepID=A0A8S5L0X2_9VIRU|nr:maturation protein [ssRNA phage SRR7976300_2]DAD51087.1 TPA_asm: maturation protein [ssRNA phage SRR7976300_2]